MERYLRFYIKFHGYVLAIGTILGTAFATFVILHNNDFHYPLDEFYDFRYMGSAALVFGTIWLAVGISMFYGVYKEVKRFIYPFAVMYMLDLFLLFFRDVVLIWQNATWYEIVLLNPFSSVIALYITLHIMMSLVALGKLFDHDPLGQPGTNFVRFKTSDLRRDTIHEVPEDAGDEVSLVTE